MPRSQIPKRSLVENTFRIHSVCPGAYATMTKVNFKALDRYVIKPVGVYGSKEEIVRFFGAIDEKIKSRRSFSLIPRYICAPNRPSV
ncbi:hypothetical protein EV363DRAFT_563391 [Boletus edulis]|nr:hypothetical protein EV363DRAFT_563391 [Boletus edulis]